jgi:hypothetical protein
VTMNEEAGAALTANRLAIPNGSTLTLTNGETATFIYSQSRWRMMSTTGAVT